MRTIENIKKELADIRKERELLNKKQEALAGELRDMYATVYATLEEAQDYG
jgi:vacuolar-type H+-ATPase subunit D/Vma8